MYGCPLSRLCVMTGDFCWLAEAVAGVGWGSWDFLCSRCPVRIAKTEVNPGWVSRILCVEDTLAGQLKLKWMQVEVCWGALCGGCPGRAAEAKAVWGAGGPWALYKEGAWTRQLKQVSVNWRDLGLYMQRTPWQDSWNSSGHKLGCTRTFHTEGALKAWQELRWGIVQDWLFYMLIALLNCSFLKKKEKKNSCFFFFLYPSATEADVCVWTWGLLRR